MRRVAAVERALAVLDALSDGNVELGTNEIARRTGINASTVSRLLATLAGAGIVEHVPETGRYRLGLRLLQLGNAVLARLDLREVARPHLQELVTETGETATLSAPGERDAITVDFVQSAASVQSVAHVGRPSIAHATATGKVQLAFGTSQLPAGQLKAYTPRTITDTKALAREIERVREQGWALVDQELEEGLRSIAVPIRDRDGAVVAAANLSTHASRSSPRSLRADLLPPLRAAAARIEADLRVATSDGHRRPAPAARG